MELSEWGKLCQNIPIPKIQGIGDNDKIEHTEFSIEWISELKEFIEYFFRFVFKDEDAEFIDNII
jgi:hypothetical protein